MKFRSKVALWYHVVHVLLAAAVLALVLDFASNGSAAAGAAALVLFLFEIYISLLLGSSYYVLEENGLLVRHGPFVKFRVDYGDIASAEETRRLRPFLVLSADALEIRRKSGGDGKAVVIAPERKREFLEKLDEKRGITAEPALDETGPQ
ncbi:MAG: PH domain-containing protein [Firmicutes bacterium]|nr:PH domain-containing protein [Bacillota bacterium]